MIFGGQNIFVTLTSSNVQFQAGPQRFSADVTITNLIPQPMGTPDNLFVTNVDIFFHTGPTNGVTVFNEDGTGNFTAPNQPFFAYVPNTHFGGGVNNTLEPNETSSTQNWIFSTSGMTGSTFQFTMLVSADVPFPNGWVELDQEPGTIEAGGTNTLTATVKDVVGRTVSGRTLTWTSTTPSVFTVVSGTGVASAVGNNSQTGTVLIASDGPEATDTASVKIYETLAARTPKTVPSTTAGGERLYKFTVPGGGPSIRPGVTPIAASVQAGGPGGRRGGADGFEAADGLLAVAAPIVTSVLGTSVDSVSTTTGDADLHVRFGAPPDIANTLWDCRPFAPGSRERCNFDDPTAGDWFLTVAAFSSITNTEVNADFVASGAGYGIDVAFLDSGLNANQQLAVTNAAGRWSSIVTGDVRPIALMALNNCNGERLNRVVDDLYVSVTTSSVDGPSGNLASAGPCFIRASGGAEDQRIPVVGTTNIDSDDLPGVLADTATLGVVVVHELGHAMGIGSLWGASQFDLINFPGTDSVTYDGTNGMAAYDELSVPVVGEVPVANTGGAGTADAHWREVTFDNELMTGFLDSGANPLSLLSAQSLADEGYTVDTTAVDAYSLPGPPIVLDGGQANPGMQLVDDVILGPIYAIEPNGDVVRIR
ncbi:MAG: pre-peptidase C-terminal domain-containing protein [Gemmatimonadota bacterium]